MLHSPMLSRLDNPLKSHQWTCNHVQWEDNTSSDCASTWQSWSGRWSPKQAYHYCRKYLIGSWKALPAILTNWRPLRMPCCLPMNQRGPSWGSCIRRLGMGGLRFPSCFSPQSKGESWSAGQQFASYLLNQMTNKPEAWSSTKCWDTPVGTHGGIIQRRPERWEPKSSHTLHPGQSNLRWLGWSPTW